MSVMSDEWLKVRDMQGYIVIRKSSIESVERIGCGLAIRMSSGRLVVTKEINRIIKILEVKP